MEVHELTEEEREQMFDGAFKMMKVYFNVVMLMLLVISGCVPYPESGPADLVIKNAKVVTLIRKIQKPRPLRLLESLL